MSKVVAIEHLTLDGVMQGPARPEEDTRDGFEYGGWAAARNDPAMMEALGARMGSSWSLLVGRTTYEDFAKVWPNQPKPNPFTEALNNVEKFVASTTLAEPLPWQNSTLLKGDAADAVAKLKKEHDKTLVILGRGRRLFPDGSPLTNFSLVDSVTTGTGVIIATYRLASR